MGMHFLLFSCLGQCVHICSELQQCDHAFEQQLTLTPAVVLQKTQEEESFVEN